MQKKIILINVFLLFFVVNFSFSQDYFEKKYPAYGGGISFGYCYYFPNDLNDYIDLQITGTKTEHINTGINVGLFLAYAPAKYIEIVPELNYMYSRHSFSYANTDLVVSSVQLGCTIYYIKMLRPGINLRFGGGASNYWGNVSWEANSALTWKGATIGFHSAVGGELVLNSNMSVSLLILGRFAKITELKHSNGYIIKKPDGSNDNLHLNLSGIEIKVMLHYYL